MSKLADGVKRDGAAKYFCNGVLHITAEVAKDKRTRQTHNPPNVAAWLERYRPTPEAICRADWALYGKIRRKFRIPHDGLRHRQSPLMYPCTAALLAQRPNLETRKMIRTHYFNRMTKAEAADFFSIVPRGVVVQLASEQSTLSAGERSTA